MKKVIWLRVYKGQEILKSEDGKVRNENSKVSLTHETLEWSLYLKSLPYNPYCKVEVEKVFEFKDGKYVECEISEKIKKEVLLAHKGDQTVKLTPDQQRIADLEAKIDSLLDKKSEKKDDNISDDELEELRKQYFDKFGKKPHHLWKSDKIKEKLNQ